MFTPPSVNQISSAYLGNPQPLAQKVEKDKQQHGGIPQDLRQLLALNDITQGRNAVGIQQALQAPAQMPTVAQSLQERARQAIQAQMMQQAQQQQAKDGQPITVPPNAPRPPMQAQGIDELRSNVGEEYAHGGIIGNVQHFDGKTRSDVKDPNLETTSTFGNLISSLIPESVSNYFQQDLEKSMERKRREDQLAEAAPGLFEQLTPEARAERLRRVSEISKNPVVAEPQKTPVSPTTMASDQAERNDAAAVDFANVVKNTADQNKRSNVVNQNKPRVNTTDNAPMPGGLADLAKMQPSGVGHEYERRALAENQKFDPEAYKQKYLKEVGAKDTSIYDQMAEELKARKERLNAPKPGIEALMDYLGDVSQAGGRNWFETGSRAAVANRAKQREREAQQDLLVDKILDLGAKKKEAEYGERLGMFNLTKAEKDRIEKDSREIAGKLSLSEDKQDELRNNMAMEVLRSKTHLQTAAIGAHDNLMSRAQALMAADPTKKMTLEQGMQKAAEIAAAGQMESADVRKNKAYIDAKEKIDTRFQHLINDTPYGQKQKALYDKAISELNQSMGLGGGINTLPRADASGKVAPPPGFKRD
jgi:hypothetical protein